MTTHLLDTDIVIEMLRGPGPRLIAHLTAHEGALGVSTVSLAELTFGAHRSRDPRHSLGALDDVKALFEILDFDDEAARHAGELRSSLVGKGVTIGPYDVLIAGHARSHGLTVATGNVREFRRVPGLLVENWRR